MAILIQTKFRRRLDQKVFNLEMVYSEELKREVPVFISEDCTDHELMDFCDEAHGYELLQGRQTYADIATIYVAKDINENKLIKIIT